MIHYLLARPLDRIPKNAEPDHVSDVSAFFIVPAPDGVDVPGGTPFPTREAALNYARKRVLR